MRRWRALLDSTNVQHRAVEVDLLRADVNQFGQAQNVREGNRIMVESRCPLRLSLAASISFSTSASVRYSRPPVLSIVFGAHRRDKKKSVTGITATTSKGALA